MYINITESMAHHNSMLHLPLLHHLNEVGQDTFALEGVETKNRAKSLLMLDFHLWAGANYTACIDKTFPRNSSH